MTRRAAPPAPDPSLSLFAAAQAAVARKGPGRASLANRGRDFEDTVEDLHEKVYVPRGVCCTRTPAPMRILRPAGKPGQFVAVFEGEGPPDWFVQAYGRSILLELKSIADDRFPLARVEKHQAERMTRHESNGGRAAVLLRLDAGIWLLPWAGLGPLWTAHHARTGRAASGTASLGTDVLSVIGIPLDSADWLPAALSLWPAR